MNEDGKYRNRTGKMTSYLCQPEIPEVSGVCVAGQAPEKLEEYAHPHHGQRNFSLHEGNHVSAGVSLGAVVHRQREPRGEREEGDTVRRGAVAVTNHNVLQAACTSRKRHHHVSWEGGRQKNTRVSEISVRQNACTSTGTSTWVHNILDKQATEADFRARGRSSSSPEKNLHPVFVS